MKRAAAAGVFVTIAIAFIPVRVFGASTPYTYRMGRMYEIDSQVEASSRIQFREILRDKRNKIFTIVGVALLVLCLAIWALAYTK